MSAEIPNSNTSTRAIAKFSSVFLGCTVFFFVLFSYFQELVVRVYVSPLSEAASFLLYWIGISSEVTTNLQEGTCTLLLGMTSYWITRGCTGLFTSALFVSGILSCPVNVRKKLIGLLIGIPAFFIFGILRVVIMAVVAVTLPARVEVFHVYIMAIANLGFAMFVWIYWFNRIVDDENAHSISG